MGYDQTRSSNKFHCFLKKEKQEIEVQRKILEDEINRLEERLEKEYEEGTLEELNNKQNELEKNHRITHKRCNFKRKNKVI